MRKFNQDDAKRLIDSMRNLYGEKFDRQWRNSEPAALIETFVMVLEDLSTAQIAAGFTRMVKTLAWPPSVPEFRLLCEQGGNWLTAEEAWVNALAFSNDANTAITVQAHEAFGRINQVLSQEGQKAAARAFKDIYQRIVSDCTNNGVKQSNYFAPRLAAPIETIDAKPCPEHILAQMKSAFRAV